MEQIHIVEVESRRQLKEFIQFPMRLYADCPKYVPPLISDEMGALKREGNPVYETAEATLLMAVRGGVTVGRIAAIISRPANEKFGTRNMRFGWFDTINSYEVAAAMFDAAEAWGKARGMTTMTGPQGFNQFGKAGMLVEGFQYLPTMATYYNHPYYNDLLARYGFEKDIDYVEYLVRNVSEQEFPEHVTNMAERVRQRGLYRVLGFPKKKDLLKRSDQIFDLLQETYSELYGVTPITPLQRAHYLKKFFPFLHERLVKIAVDKHDEMVGFFIAMPSLSVALRKARGRLFPFGLFHLWRASRGASPTLDLCLAGVRKKCRGQGVDVLMASEMSKTISQMGFVHAEAYPQLETNLAVRGEWRPFDHVMHKRRRVYKKVIGQRAVSLSA